MVAVGCSLRSYAKLSLVQGQWSKDQAYLCRTSYTALLWEAMEAEQASGLDRRNRKICKHILPSKHRSKEEAQHLLKQSWHADHCYHLILRKMSANGCKNQRSRGRGNITPEKRGTVTYVHVLGVWVQHFKLYYYWDIFLCVLFCNQTWNSDDYLVRLLRFEPCSIYCWLYIEGVFLLHHNKILHATYAELPLCKRLLVHF